MNIGLLGFGVVGRGVYDMLAGRDDIRAAWVLCRRDLGELTAQTTYEMQDILDDPAVDTVVEVMPMPDRICKQRFLTGIFIR